MPQPDRRQVIDRLLSASDAIRGAIERQYARRGLNPARVGLLRQLAQAGPEGRAQIELARALDLAESTICGLIDRLQSEGQLYRFRSRSDRRRSLVMVSAQGRELLDQIEADSRRLIELLLAGFEPSDLARLSQLLESLEQAAAVVQNASPAPRASAPRATSSSNLREAG